MKFDLFNVIFSSFSAFFHYDYFFPLFPFFSLIFNHFALVLIFRGRTSESTIFDDA